MSSRASSVLGWVAASSLLLAGCGAEATPEDKDEAPDDAGPSGCPEGQVTGPAGSCMPVGIQSCAALFVGADGLCHPTIDLCPAGTIPKLEEGCASVGIPGCAPGFLEADGLCHPAMSKCPTGTFASPEGGCVPIDGTDGCGVSAWGLIPDTPTTLYVDPSRLIPNGDGSKTRPLTTIAGALALVAPGGTIALAQGDYRERVVIAKPVAIVGRCASMVRLGCAQPADCNPAIVSIDRVEGASLRGLQIGGAGVGIDAANRAVVQLDQVHVAAATATAVSARGAGTQVSLTHVWVDGTRPGGDGAGVGLRVTGGAAATVDGSAFSGSRGKAVLAAGPGSTVLLRGALIEGTRLDLGGNAGVGAVGGEGGQVTLERSAVVGSSIYGVLAQAPGSSVAIRESLVEGTSPDPATGDLGLGVAVASGASATIDRSAVVRNTTAGVAVFPENSALEMTGTLVRDTVLGTLDGSRTAGFGVIVTGDGAVRLDGDALVSNRSAGLVVQQRPGEPVRVTRSLIQGTLPDAGGAGGMGVYTSAGRIALASSAVIGNRSSGVFATEKGSEVDATEVLFENNLPEESTRRYGHGVELSPGARLTLARSALLHHYDFGMVLIDDAERTGSASILDTLIQGNVGSMDGDWGGGVAVYQVPTTISGVVLRDHRMAALLLDHAKVSVGQTVIDGIVEGFGYVRGQQRVSVADGVTATGATMDLADVEVTGCARAGIFYDGSTGTIAGTRATRNRFGFVVQGDEQPVTAEGCAFIDNSERDVVRDGDFLVPDAPAPLP